MAITKRKINSEYVNDPENEAPFNTIITYKKVNIRGSDPVISQLLKYKSEDEGPALFIAPAGFRGLELALELNVNFFYIIDKSQHGIDFWQAFRDFLCDCHNEVSFKDGVIAFLNTHAEKISSADLNEDKNYILSIFAKYDFQKVRQFILENTVILLDDWANENVFQTIRDEFKDNVYVYASNIIAKTDNLVDQLKIIENLADMFPILVIHSDVTATNLFFFIGDENEKFENIQLALTENGDAQNRSLKKIKQTTTANDNIYQKNWAQYNFLVLTNKVKTYFDDKQEAIFTSYTQAFLFGLKLSDYVKVSHQSILEIGASNGGVLKDYQSQGLKVMAYDSCPIAVKVLQQKNIPYRQIDLNYIVDNKLGYEESLREDLAQPTNIIAIRILEYLEEEPLKLLLFALSQYAAQDSVFIFVMGINFNEDTLKEAKKGKHPNYIFNFFSSLENIEILKHTTNANDFNKKLDLVDEMLVMRKK